MKLYYAPGTCALACCIALEWANADYEVQKVDYADPAYKKINPLMAFLTGDFHPAYWPMFSPQRYTTDKTPAAHDAVRAAAYPRIDRVMTFLDGLIGERGHVYRSKRTVADAYAYVMARWSVKTPKPYTQYPHLAAFMTRMGEDEAVKRVLAASNA